jgi:hypothetical protein
VDRALRLRLVAAAVLLVGSATSCSVIFSADDLSNGTSGAMGGGGAAASSSGHGGHGGHGGSGGCKSDADCDDGDDCTRDSCDKATHRCTHPADDGAPCGPAGTDCTPRGKCNAQKQCVAGQPDVSKCDDQNPCTLDTCETSGCRHAPDVGIACDDGNPCDDVGTCNGQGKCIGAKKPVQEICGGGGMLCPGNFYISDYHCNTFCGGCPLCVNAFNCTFACTPTFVACCDIGTGDCSAACPAGYHANGGPVSAPQCGCGSGTGVNCQQDAP